MDFMSDAVPFEREGWQVSTISTSVHSTHALYVERASEIVCLGIRTAADEAVEIESVEPILSAIEKRMEHGGFAGDYGVADGNAGRFDALAHLSGDFRRFARGWANEVDVRVVQVIPCFRCELDAAWPAAKFVGIVRLNMDLFDPDRAIRPYLEIIMVSSAFNRPITKWTFVEFTTVLTYVPALINDPNSELSVRNLDGAVLTFNRETGWASYRERILEHACMR